LISACAILFFLYMLYKFNYADERFILYYPIYALGIFCHSLTLPEKFNIKTMLALALFMAFSLCMYQINPEHIIVKWLSEISVTMLIIEISKLITVKCTYKFFSIISYASLCAYLFHRQFFYVVNRLFGDVPLIIMYLLILPTFLLVSWWIQKMYDSFVLKRLFVRKLEK